jgi:hypothetical protein
MKGETNEAAVFVALRARSEIEKERFAGRA